MEAFDSFISWPKRTFEQLVPVSAREVTDPQGRTLVQVSSTQYLGILWNEDIRKQLGQVLKDASSETCGSFGSNFLGGTHPARVEFEEAISREVFAEATLGFASGWAANYAISEMCCKCCDLLVSDVRSHNSVIQGLRNATTIVIVADLTTNEWHARLRGLSYHRACVFTPSIEGIAGEAVIPTFPEEFRARALWIQDESHTFGALGVRGSESFHESQPDLRVLGLSKAYGTLGAAVCGSRELIDVLAQVGSPWIFSTALPPLYWKLNLGVLPIMVGMERERRKIVELAALFRSRSRECGLHVTGKHHISGVHVGPGSEMASDATLREAGFLARVSMFPTRPKEDPCVRIAFSPAHTVEDVERLVSVFTSLPGVRA